MLAIAAGVLDEVAVARRLAPHLGLTADPDGRGAGVEHWNSEVRLVVELIRERQEPASRMQVGKHVALAEIAVVVLDPVE